MSDSYNIEMFDANQYKDYAEALSYNSVVTTWNTIDAVSSWGGLYDTGDIISTLERCSGMQVEAGIVYNTMFISLKHLLAADGYDDTIQDVLEAWAS